MVESVFTLMRLKQNKDGGREHRDHNMIVSYAIDGTFPPSNRTPEIEYNRIRV
jgi:hypothetical protein